MTSEQELVSATSEQVTDKPDDVASNTDTGYETGSVASALSSSQITKVRWSADRIYSNTTPLHINLLFLLFTIIKFVYIIRKVSITIQNNVSVIQFQNACITVQLLAVQAITLL